MRDLVSGTAAAVIVTLFIGLTLLRPPPSSPRSPWICSRVLARSRGYVTAIQELSPNRSLGLLGQTLDRIESISWRTIQQHKLNKAIHKKKY